MVERELPSGPESHSTHSTQECWLFYLSSNATTKTKISRKHSNWPSLGQVPPSGPINYDQGGHVRKWREFTAVGVWERNSSQKKWGRRWADCPPSKKVHWLILQKWKFRLREIQWLTQGYNLYLNSSHLAPSQMLGSLPHTATHFVKSLFQALSAGTVSGGMEGSGIKGLMLCWNFFSAFCLRSNFNSLSFV